jgi:hypothetical protein
MYIIAYRVKYTKNDYIQKHRFRQYMKKKKKEKRLKIYNCLNDIKNQHTSPKVFILLNPRPTTLKDSMLSITPPMWFPPQIKVISATDKGYFRHR